MSFRELAIILVVVAAGAALIYYETGRDRAILAAAGIMLAIFAIGGFFAAVAT